MGKKEKVFTVALIIFFFMGPVGLFSLSKEEKSKLESLEQRIENLEGQKELLKKHKESLERDVKFIKESYEEYQKRTNKEIEFEYGFIKYLGTILGFIGLTGLIGIYFWIRSKLYKKLEKKFREEFDDRNNAIKALITESDWENKIREESNILVYPVDEGNKAEEVSDMLMKLGLRSRISDSEEDFSKYTAVVVCSNSNTGEIKNNIENVLARSEETFCFYYGKERIILKEEWLNRFSSCNFKSQLYGNLLNGLRYQRDVLSKK